MAAENPTWGAPRIHGEMLMLGLDVSERTVSRLMLKRSPDPEARQQWRTFLRNHREVLAAMDFLTVPTAIFRVLYVFFVIHHARRTLLRTRNRASDCGMDHPAASRSVPVRRRPSLPRLRQRQEVRVDVLAVIEHMGIRRKQITPYSPWQNGVAERWGKTARCDLLDHVIVLNERHLRRLVSEFVAYYQDYRTHLGLGKSTPSMRRATSNPNRNTEIVGHPRLGGLRHRYEWRQAA